MTRSPVYFRIDIAPKGQNSLAYRCIAATKKLNHECTRSYTNNICAQ